MRIAVPKFFGRNRRVGLHFRENNRGGRNSLRAEYWIFPDDNSYIFLGLLVPRARPFVTDSVRRQSLIL